MKYYAVKKGRKTGIFTSWEECEKQVKGFASAKFCSFSSLELAKEYMENDDTKKSRKTERTEKHEQTEKQENEKYEQTERSEKQENESIEKT